MTAREIVTALGGHWHGRHGMVRCPTHDDRSPSLSVADGEDRLLVKCFAGCDARDVLAALRERGLLQPNAAQVPQVAASRSPIVGELFPLLQPAHATQDLAPWKRAQPITRDCPVGRYLIGRRCILPPNDVRWIPAQDGGFPEMVALITDAITTEPISLHRTFVARDGIGKAPLAKARKYLAGHRKAGGVVRLHRDDEVTTGLGIAEGIETALAVAATGWAPVWAALDAGNIAAFPVLPGIEALTVFADHDEAGLKAARQCCERWVAAGREARIATPMSEGKGWNDVVIQETAA
jgi:hypothetical protein